MSTITLLNKNKWVWDFLRMEFIPFSSKADVEQWGVESLITCYYKTPDSIARQLKIPLRTLKRYFKSLEDEGCLFGIPFRDKQGNRRRSLIPLDPELEDYEKILSMIQSVLIERLKTAQDGGAYKRELANVQKFLLEPPVDWSERTISYNKEPEPY